MEMSTSESYQSDIAPRKHRHVRVAFQSLSERVGETVTFGRWHPNSFDAMARSGGKRGRAGKCNARAVARDAQASHGREWATTRLTKEVVCDEDVFVLGY